VVELAARLAPDGPLVARLSVPTSLVKTLATNTTSALEMNGKRL
jgi:hypothetical protein